MNKRISFFIYISIFLIFQSACANLADSKKAEVTEAAPQKKKRERKGVRGRFPRAIDRAKFFEKDGVKYLYGGKKDGMDFEITNCSLVDSLFHFGIGREHFSALLKPEFISKEEADVIWNDSARFLLLTMDGVAKAYSVQDLTKHEIVNDEVNGKPIMAAYCILADLGAIYDRTFNGRTHTFALSGYTYHDPKVWDGLDGFVWWDRETESLWWPLIDKAVSGSMKDTPLKILDGQYWQDTDWGEIARNYPDVQVLKSGQDFTRPENWKRY